MPCLAACRAACVQAAKPGLVDKEAAAQKKAFKVLAALCEQRPSFLQAHLADVLGQVSAPRADDGMMRENLASGTEHRVLTTANAKPVLLSVRRLRFVALILPFALLAEVV